MKDVIEAPTTSAVSAGQGADAVKFSFRHILAPTDFSPNSEKAMDCAVQLARRLSAKLTLLHIIPEPSALDYSIGGIPSEEIELRQQDAEKKLAEQLPGQSLSTSKSARHSAAHFILAMKSFELLPICRLISW